MTGASNESCEFNTTPTGTRPKKDTGRDDSVRRSKILAEVADANPNHIRPAEGPCAGMLVDKQSCGESEVVTEAGVRKVQEAWAQAIKSISKVHLEGGDFIGVAGEAAAELYAYGHTNVLFKPTKAAEVQFRPTAEGAMSYFVGAANVKSGPIEEDSGFAINGGKGWSDVQFENHTVTVEGTTAIAMGNYYFTCATTGTTTKVEYTFGYRMCDDGKLRIFLHHSSLPYALH